MCALRKAILAASAGDTASNTWLLTATWRVRVGRVSAVGGAMVRNPAFSSCQTYWLRALHGSSALASDTRLSRQPPGTGPVLLLPLTT